MAKKKFYAVRKGVVPGIYSSWAETERQVKGFPGAQFKGFATSAEAQAWLKGENVEKTPPKKKRVREKETPQSRSGAIVIYTDGGCLNNPGPGGYGAVIVRGEEEMELSGGYRLTTNNRMEMTACIAALKEAHGKGKKIDLYSDSSYVVNAVSKGWVKNWQKNGWRKSDGQPVLNKDLWQELLGELKKSDVCFHWVKGHAGNPLNERCDRLATKAMLMRDLPRDAGYEE